MYLCEDCKPLVTDGRTFSQSTPSRKTKCKRCGKEDWCFKIIRRVDGFKFRYSPCSHIKAIKDKLTPNWGWRDEPDTLQYGDLQLNKCPTCDQSIDIEIKTIEDWDISGT